MPFNARQSGRVNGRGPRQGGQLGTRAKRGDSGQVGREARRRLQPVDLHSNPRSCPSTAHAGTRTVGAHRHDGWCRATARGTLVMPMPRHRLIFALPLSTILIIGGLLASAAPVAAVASECDALSGNLLTNCGFETGDFTGWSQGGNTGLPVLPAAVSNTRDSPPILVDRPKPGLPRPGGHRGGRLRVRHPLLRECRE